MKNRRFLFLYTEIAGYTVACLKALKNAGVDIAIVRWPVNPEAPFQFDLTGIADDHFTEEFATETALASFCQDFNPDVIYVSGWIDKKYLSAARAFKKKVPVVLGMDTPWTGSGRQRLGSLASRFILHPIFSHAFVAGSPQKTFARKLGFAQSNIIEGLYCADTTLYNHYFQSNPKPEIPRRFLYTGRYMEHKGILDLYAAYQAYRNASENPWEIWCAGTGDLYEARPQIAGLTHLGFVQPQEFGQVIQQTGVFILPSHYEPWGVVVHEYAVAGYPLICSDAVMAHTRFIETDRNGLLFPHGNTEALTAAMLRISSLTPQLLKQMSDHSHHLGLQLTPELWASTLTSLNHVRN
jgi:glycosyltransferase involved in cell wall biosynthesis